MKTLTPGLDQELIRIVSSFLKGKRLEKFLTSVSLIQESLEKGGWVPGASRKAQTGFYQGNGIKIPSRDRSCSELYFCCRFGNAVNDMEAALYAFSSLPQTIKYPLEFVRAWMELCNQKEHAIEFLNETRPLPVITKIGLSPKVTKTLLEANLDIELDTITMAEIKFRMVPKVGPNGEYLLNSRGDVNYMAVYFVNWKPNTLHHASRFASLGTHCEACGKRIPSGRFVPIQAQDRKQNRPVSFWVGTDCARALFGIKDVGLEREAGL